MDIPFLDLKRLNSGYEAKINTALNRVVSSGWYILGGEVSKFESDFARIQNAEYCSAVANGLEALEIIIKSRNYPIGSEVLTTSVTAFATTLAIVRAGCTPVLVDIDPLTGLMSSMDAKNKISSKTVAMVYVHLYGNISRIDQMVKLCEEAGIELIEDCAQSHLGAIGNKSCGTFGVAGAFSFYPTKNLGSLGDAGAIITDLKIIKDKSDMLRNYGQKKQYENVLLGQNSRMHELQAAVLNVKLEGLVSDTLKRQRVAKRYMDEIDNSKVIPLTRNIKNFEDVFHLFVVKVENKEMFVEHLAKHNIGSLVHYPKSIGEYGLTGNGKVTDETPKAVSFTKSIVSLPCNPYLTRNEISKIIDVTNIF